jgi:NTE family protein
VDVVKSAAGEPATATAAAIDTAPLRPPIGLALGSGAARGWAHIGVVRTLVAGGYVPEIIAGTSIGAVVGGCQAAGCLRELEDWTMALTRRRIFSLLDLSLGGSAIISGARLRSLLDRDLGNMQIEDLPVRLTAIATELATGHEVWLNRGPLVEAIIASYALPGIFEAARLGGRWLVDGALVNPVPVSAARAMGARVVIAVNLNGNDFGRGAVVAAHGAAPGEIAVPPPAPPTGRALLRQRLKDPNGGPPGIPTVMMEAFNITQDRIARARLAGDPPDVAIMPRVGHIGLFDFHRAEEAIALGAEAARGMLGAIEEAVTALA